MRKSLKSSKKVRQSRLENYLVRFLEIDSPQQENIDKILNLLDEIRDPFAGQATPAMIGLEYLGSLQTI